MGNPGAPRSAKLLHQVYGETKADVEKELVSVTFPGGKRVRVHRKVAPSLKQAMTEIQSEIDARKASSDTKLAEAMLQYFNSADCFNWRNIAGTNVRSTHSFGITCDLNPKITHYWVWDEAAGVSWKDTNRTPALKKIILILERYGFTSGVRWRHYDDMHFEYRPEYFASACGTSNSTAF